MKNQFPSPKHENMALELSAFLRRFQLRKQSIMWLLGAGASRAAGIKTAWDMIWDFKRSIYRSQKGVSESELPDNADSQAQEIIQLYFDETGNFPPLGDPSEYAAYFEAAYDAESDRRSYIDKAVSSARPTIGHRVLVELMKMNSCDIVWTTNFDRLIEDAAADVFKTTGRLTVVELNNSSTVDEAISESRWPLCVKLHGDFQNRRLKNTASELQSQDKKLRRALVEACKSRGLAIMGCSGRDESVMKALAQAINAGGFPQSIFWFHLDDGQIFPEVSALVRDARTKGIDAYLVAVPSFDKAMSEIATFLPELENLAIQNDIESYRDMSRSTKSTTNLANTTGNAEKADEIKKHTSRKNVATLYPRSTNLQLRKEFTQVDKENFLLDSFIYFAQFFESSLKELEKQNPGIETRYRRIDENSFTAVIFKNGNKESACTVRISGTFLGSLRGGYSNITYSGRENAPANTANEIISVEHDDQNLYLKTMGLSFPSNANDVLRGDGAAEYLWSILIRPLQ